MNTNYLWDEPRAFKRTVHSASISKTKIELIWWYLAILVPTIVFKYLYLDAVYFEGLSVALENIVEHPTTIDRWLYTILFFAKDIVECSVLVGLFYLVGHRLLRINVNLLIPSTVILCLLIAVANWISFSQLKTFFTVESASISFAWLSENPELLQTYLGKRNLAFFLLAMVWSVVPLLMVKGSTYLWSSGKVHYQSFRLLVTVIVISGIVYYGVTSVSFKETPLPLRGYWSSTAGSLFGANEKNLLQTKAESVSELQARLDRLMYPRGRKPTADYLIDLSGAQLKPRHIVIVGLETAPRKYYPIIDNPALPNFLKMSSKAIVTEKHYTNTPFTGLANFAMLSGAYPTSAGVPIKYGDLATDGLASILSKQGYETIYVDSYIMDWHKGKSHQKVVESLGFRELIDNKEELQGMKRSEKARYDLSLHREAKSFRHAMEGIKKAQSRDKRALVFIDTILGHYKWKAKPGDEDLPNEEKVLGICKEFDNLLGSLLEFLEKENLIDDTLVLVTGDHGLRYREEFASLNERMAHSDVAFNVPFLLYAPGLLDNQVRVAQVTSHVDITPTLLELVGVSTESLFHHGSNILDRRIEDRVSFMMNSGLSPIDGFHWRGYFFTLNNLTGAAELTTHPGAGGFLKEAHRIHEDIPQSLQDPKQILHLANEFFDASATYFLQRDVSDHEQGDHALSNNIDIGALQ